MGSTDYKYIANEGAPADQSVTKIDQLQSRFAPWLAEDVDSDIVISSRIRLARNLKGFAFPNRATRQELSEVTEKVKTACLQSKSLKQALIIEMGKLSELDKKFLVERRLASPQFIEQKYPAMLVVGKDEDVSIMVNEEDHLRIQTITAGIAIQKAWRRIRNVDDDLDDHLVFCYSRDFGYLTSCPTNTGTGLRVSFFVHAPALIMSGQEKAVLEGLSSSEITIRGFYGEGSEPVGNVFQVSNQLTLGRMEKNIIARMTAAAKNIVDMERQARDELLRVDRVKLEDMAYRAFGTLKYARILSSMEAMNLISNVRLGCDLGIINSINRVALNQLLALIQPAHLQKSSREQLDAVERDQVRADYIREYLHI